jgi:hypothetical protein
MADGRFETFKAAARYQEILGARAAEVGDEALPEALHEMYAALGCGGFGGGLLWVPFTEGGEPSPGLLDLHYKTSRPAYATDLADFFDRVATMDDWVDEELRPEQFVDAREEHGDLGEDECYYFVPALALGGSEEGPFDKGQWAVHADLLRQM